MIPFVILVAGVIAIAIGVAILWPRPKPVPRPYTLVCARCAAETDAKALNQQQGIRFDEKPDEQGVRYMTCEVHGIVAYMWEWR